METEANRSVIARLDSAMLILIVTAYSYTLSFVYETAYLGHFGLPTEFAEVNLQRLLVCAGVAFGGVLLVFLAFDSVLQILPTNISARVRAKALEVTVSAVLVVTFLRLAEVPEPWPTLIFMLFPGSKIFTNFILPIWKYRGLPSYWKKVEVHVLANDRPSSDDRGVMSIVATKLGGATFAQLGLAYLVLWGTHLLGGYVASEQTEFMVSLGESCVVIDVRSDGWLCVGFDEKTHALRRQYRVIRPIEKELSIEKLGRLRPAVEKRFSIFQRDAP